MDSQRQNQTWGTWEDLLLACAVQRHGSNDWDSVALEVQSRTSLPHILTTPRDCQNKFHDLKRRFSTPHNDTVSNNADPIPWLEELRNLRLAELRQEVQRSDVSILSLQLKVKRLQEERERSLTGNDENGGDKPDLDVPGETRSENDKKSGGDKGPEPDCSEPETFRGSKLTAGDESDRENQSVNESNSTGSRTEDRTKSSREVDVKQEPVSDQAGSDKPDHVSGEFKPVGEESNNGGENRTDNSPPLSQERKAEEDSSDLRDSVGHLRDREGETRTRESSDVQSSASLTRKRKRRRRKEISGASSGEEMPENDEASVKSQPLVGLLELIKAHEHSSLFERRVESQETDKFRNIVRQPVDMETIQSRLNKGSYSSCSLAFLRDLLLLFNNAIVFFPKDSTHSHAAIQLRRLVSQEIKNQFQNQLCHSTKSDSLPPNTIQMKSQQFETSDSLLSKHNTSGPILVCRKKSSISAKPSSASLTQKGDQTSDDKKPALDTKTPVKPSDTDDEEPQGINTKPKEKPITGVRSLRRSNKNLSNNNTSDKKLNANSASKGSSDNKSETSKTDKNKSEASPLDKKRSAADFLKRIKKNSPAEALRSSGGGSSKSGVNSGKEQKRPMGIGSSKGREKVSRNNNNSRDRRHANESPSPSKRNVGRPPKKAAETNTKRGRENGGKDESPTKRPRKRSRR